MLKSVIKLSGKIPLRVIIIVPFVIQILAAIGMTSWLSFRNNQQAIEDLATQLRLEITDRISQYLDTQTRTAYIANQVNVDAIRLGLLNLEDTFRLQQHFWKQVPHLGVVTYVGLGTATGTYIGAQFLKNGSIFIEMANEQTHGDLQIWQMDKMGNRSQLINTLPNYDPRQRPWYQVAVKKGEPVWTDFYFSSRRTTLSANQPIYDEQGHLIAVATADLALIELGEFLRALQIGQPGQAFVIERSGLMVATSTPEVPYRVTQAFQQADTLPSLSPERRYSERLNKIERFKAIDSTDNITRATASFLNQYFGDLVTIKESQYLDFSLNNQRYFLQVRPFPLDDNQREHGLDWLIVVVIPEADFINPLVKNEYLTLGLGLIALVVAIGVGIATARWLVDPLLYLNQAAKALAKGQ